MMPGARCGAARRMLRRLRALLPARSAARSDGRAASWAAVRVMRQEAGQATVEFAVITAAFLVITAALGAMRHVVTDGLLVEHAVAVASHHLQAVAPATIGDIFLY